MLITLAILLIMMTVIVKIFQAATGALNAAQVYQELDNQLRLLDSTIRSDLNGVTASMTPPNNPNNNKGYFEYGENEFADVQGEDADDYIRFTAKAPAGQPFTGRMWVRGAYLNSPTINARYGTNQNVQPITITSEYAEIIYFLRNGNLYRRVLLVAPSLQSTIEPAVGNVNPNLLNAGFFPAALGGFPVSLTGNQVSWQAVNDLSAHPAPTGTPFSNNSVILNTLSDLTSRENRAFYQRFSSDFEDISGNYPTSLYGDGLTDDTNGDNVPDFYPTLYPQIINGCQSAAGQLIWEPNYPNVVRQAAAMATMAFPFVYPGAYSCPQVLSTGTAPYGWIHSPNPQVYTGPVTNSSIDYDTNPLGYLQGINHNPIDAGDNLALPPSNPRNFLNGTWWGFPTWRETLSTAWTDPTLQVNYQNPATNNLPAQPFALTARPVNPPLVNNNLTGIPPYGNELLPAMTATWRVNPQPFTDTYGGNTGFFTATGTLWSQYSWEDDLVMTGVRSFDIKAYDNSLAGYADLGWGDDPRLTGLLVPKYLAQTTTTIPYLAGNLDPLNGPVSPAYTYISGGKYNLLTQTFAHEGRMPPLQADNRLDAQYPNPNYTNYTVPYPQPNSTYVPQYPGPLYTNYSSNVGDDNPALVRLRRVWDSWSTEYTQAPATGVYQATGFLAGPPYSPPVYPSYPPPYPAPLRGLQIQIRVTDPTNQRIKTLTIRQDFTDKL